MEILDTEFRDLLSPGQLALCEKSMDYMVELYLDYKANKPFMKIKEEDKEIQELVRDW